MNNDNDLQAWYQHAEQAGYVFPAITPMLKATNQTGWQGGRAGGTTLKSIEFLQSQYKLLRLSGIKSALKRGRNVGVGIHRSMINLIIIEPDDNVATAWLEQLKFPLTLSWVTPRGGIARLYKLPDGHKAGALVEGTAKHLTIGGKPMGELGIRHLGSYQVGPGSQIGKKAYDGKDVNEMPKGEPPWHYTIHTTMPVTTLGETHVGLLEEATLKHSTVSAAGKTTGAPIAAPIGERDNKLYQWIQFLVFHEREFTFESIRTAVHALNTTKYVEIPLERHQIDYKVDRAIAAVQHNSGFEPLSTDATDEERQIYNDEIKEYFEERRRVTLIPRQTDQIQQLEDQIKARGFSMRMNVRNYTVEAYIERLNNNSVWNDRRYKNVWFNVGKPGTQPLFHYDIVNHTEITPTPNVTDKRQGLMKFNRPHSEKDFQYMLGGVAVKNCHDPFLDEVFIPAIAETAVDHAEAIGKKVKFPQVQEAVKEIVEQINYEGRHKKAIVKPRQLIYENGKAVFKLRDNFLDEDSSDAREDSVIDNFFGHCFDINFGSQSERAERLNASIISSRTIHRGIALRTIIPGCKHEVRTTLIGDGGFGKTEVILRLLGEQRWTSSGAELFKGSQKMLESLGECVILFVDEIGGYTRDKYDQWKRISSEPTDRFRWPYARKPETMQRRFITLSASNKPQPLPHAQKGIVGDYRREIILDIKSKHGSMVKSAKHAVKHTLQTAKRRMFEGFLDAIAGLPNYIPAHYEQEQERRNMRFCRDYTQAGETLTDPDYAPQHRPKNAWHSGIDRGVGKDGKPFWTKLKDPKDGNLL